MERSDCRQEDSLKKSLAVCAGIPDHQREEPDGGVKSVKITDGSRGVTYTDANGKVHGICMPSPCALGGSFDRELLREVGKAVGSMAKEGGFNAVMSPDFGVVRSPLFGGLADCFGEDPYLNGVLGAEWVNGVQSVGTAAVMSHFAGSRQSGGKFTCDSIIDRRALREIYLSPFETAVKLSQPRAVYCGFNQINGVACSENADLLTEMLRREWKFEGAVLADMRLSDSVAAMESGVDMSWPCGGRRVQSKLRRAVRDGLLPEHYPGKCARKIREMTRFEPESCSEPMSEEACRELARTAAEQCAVLLKNQKNTLPLPLSGSIALIGRQAKSPRIQRRGADTLRVGDVENMLHVFDDNQIRYQYCEGFDEASKTNGELLAEAVQCASKSEFAVVFVGFDDVYDNNSADRFTNQLPKAQTKLINAVAKANANTVVVVGGSALPKMNWIGKVKSVLYMPLCGEETCEALFRLLFGLANPCGRLAVSYSLNEADMSCGDTFGTNPRRAEFRESIYVGYRYYNKAGIYAAFPFGYGLSYTRFAYDHMRASKCAEGWEVTLDVKNIGKRDGAEVVQFYVEAPKGDKFRPERELKQFHKVYLNKGEKRAVRVILPHEALVVYDAELRRYGIHSGRYRICAAASSGDIRADVWVSVKGEPVPDYRVPRWYLRPTGRPTQEQFQVLFGRKADEIQPYAEEQLSVDSTLNELCAVSLFRSAVKCIRLIADRRIKAASRREPEYAERMDGILNMPVRRLSGLCHGLYPMKLTKLAAAIFNRRGGALNS